MDSSILPTGLFRDLARPALPVDRPRRAEQDGTLPVVSAAPTRWEAQRQALAPYSGVRRFKPVDRSIRNLEKRRRKLQGALALLGGAAQALEHQRVHLEVETKALGEPGEGLGT